MNEMADTDDDLFTVVDHRAGMKGVPAGTTWRASWHNFEDWEGSDVQYRDIYAAFPLVLKQYLYDEYAYTAGEDADMDAPDSVFVWRCVRGVWRLFDNSEDTGVRLHSVEVMGI